MQRIRIGTRGSKLALYQANYVADLLQQRNLETEIVVIETKGDQILDVAISKIGSKGVFTEELEVQLEKGSIDIAVHSAKDMQSSLPEGFELIAFTEREKTNDVILSHHSEIDISAKDQPIIVGTSSNRRISTLRHFYPHIRTVEMRGNLQTRIAKMEAGACHALLLAYAGVHRMGYDHMIRQTLSLDEFTPAVGQGTIAVEAYSGLDNDLRRIIIEAVHDPITGYCLEAERTYLRILEGGCSIPVFALAQFADGNICINGGIVSLDGKTRISHYLEGKPEYTSNLGEQLAAKVLSTGGKQILSEIREQLNK